MGPERFPSWEDVRIQPEAEIPVRDRPGAPPPRGAFGRRFFKGRLKLPSRLIFRTTPRARPTP